MTFNSDLIIKDIRTDFEKVLDFVMGAEPRTASADCIDRGLFKLLLAPGVKLLTLFFALRSQACSRESLVLQGGRQFVYHRESKRDTFLIFGKLAIWRPYFYKKGLGGKAPLDAALSLGADCYSDLVRDVSEYLMDYSTYLAKGWPIVSGVIEGACRHLVKDRCELSGMRCFRSVRRTCCACGQ